MEQKSKGVVFALTRDTLGVTVVVKEISSAGLPDFSQQEIQEIVGYFNSQPLPTELAFPPDRPSHQANLLIITEAMVKNAIEEASKL